MSTDLPQQAPKWKSANHELELLSDKVEIMKQSSGECMKH